MLEEKIPLIFYAAKIKRSLNKEGINNILSELIEKYSLTAENQFEIIDFFEKYFQRKNIHHNSPFNQSPSHEKKIELCATDNSEILDALKNFKKLIGAKK